MPVSADPDRTVDVWLESDAEKPIESRPVIICRYLTRRQVSRIGELLDRAAELKSGDEAWKCLYDAWRIGVVGWRNQKTDDGAPAPEFDPGERLPELLDSVFTETEIQWFALAYPGKVRIAEADRRFFVSPVTSPRAQSANPVTDDATNSPATEPQTQAA